MGRLDQERCVVVLMSAALMPACDAGPTRVSQEVAPTELGRNYCERAANCGCAQFDAQAVQACKDDIDATLQAVRMRAESLIYDPACWGAEIDRLQELDCDWRGPAPRSGRCENACFPYHGTAAAGQSCENVAWGLSNCAQGLACEYMCDDGGECERRCVDPCGVAELGEPCDGLVCASPWICALDPADPSRPRTCRTPLADGQPCTGHRQCASGYCPVGHCAPVPQLGQSCAGTRVCGDDLRCDPSTETCVPGSPAICRAYANLP